MIHDIASSHLKQVIYGDGFLACAERFVSHNC